MAQGTSNRDGGKTSESGHLRAFAKAFVGDVFQGLNVSQRAAGANMSVDVAIGDTLLRRSDGTYAHPSFNDAVKNLVIGTADPSNPRRDLIVMYLDYGITPSTAVSNNTNGVVDFKVVAGTAAGSPVDPNGAAVQAAVGSGNPYTILGRARVGAGVTTISNSVIDDLRTMASPVYAPESLAGADGYYISPDSFVYVSATSFKIVGKDVRSRFPIGTKIWLDQSGSKYFYVSATPSYSTDTTVVVNGGATYSIANTTINNPKYSYASSPQGFPDGLVDSNGWKVRYVGGRATYTKSPTFSQSVGGTPASLSLSASTLPTGMSALGTNNMNWTMVVGAGGNAYGISWNPEMTSASTSLNISVRSNDGTTRTYSGYIDITILAA